MGSAWGCTSSCCTTTAHALLMAEAVLQMCMWYTVMLAQCGACQCCLRAKQKAMPLPCFRVFPTIARLWQECNAVHWKEGRKEVLPLYMPTRASERLFIVLAQKVHTCKHPPLCRARASKKPGMSTKCTSRTAKHEKRCSPVQVKRRCETPCSGSSHYRAVCPIQGAKDYGTHPVPVFHLDVEWST
ncbi:hypothetical protein DUNSADRAFT_8318 [Dunaliella salina]|uniref:Secreted protein n=1 Tax=Dunaliella salina TaxID=3046 RepID=A0ABQ7H5W1_DUNSA|nr:hypothetical protein DUNSADRAFT_8318 [Dunaliella salina]|eukprot:KAF5842255.1 hypothetical protein DUNSADRAFT_8318 [Dunaliella salina]